MTSDSLPTIKPENEPVRVIDGKVHGIELPFQPTEYVRHTPQPPQFPFIKPLDMDSY